MRDGIGEEKDGEREGGGKRGREEIVSCSARTCLLARNGLVNKVEFLGLIPQKW